MDQRNRPRIRHFHPIRSCLKVLPVLLGGLRIEAGEKRSDAKVANHSLGELYSYLVIMKQHGRLKDVPCTNAARERARNPAWTELGVRIGYDLRQRVPGEARIEVRNVAVHPKRLIGLRNPLRL